MGSIAAPALCAQVRVKRDEIVQLSVAGAGAKEGVLPEITDEDLVPRFFSESVPIRCRLRLRSGNSCSCW